jgi:thiamine pyrophosphokinase
MADVCILTDYGRMDAIHTSRNFACLPGQQVSIFSLTPHTKITVHGLLYPVENRSFTSWWQGTLNETIGDNFRIEMDQGHLLVYRLY